MRLLKSLFFLLSFFTVVCFGQATVYMTAEDYGKEEAVVYKEVALVKNSLILSEEDGSVKVFDLKKEKVWGYRNNFGEDYRIKKAGKVLRIIEYGKICIYSNISSSSSTLNPDIDSRWKENQNALTKAHSFSIGAKGKIFKFSNGRFLKALKSDPAVYQKFEKLINANNRELLLKVVEHNASL